MRRACLCSILTAASLAHAMLVAADSGETADPREMPETLPQDPSLAGGPVSDQVEVLPELDGPETSSDDDSQPLPFRFEATLQGMLAVPFSGERGDTALGYAITYGVGYGALPLLFGVDFMSASSGDDSTVVVPATDDRPALNVRQGADNRTLYFDLWLRVQPLHWPVRPYVEGFVGTKLAQTRFTLIRAGADSAEGQTVSAQDWSRSLGWGAGVDFAGLFQLADALSITLGMRRLHSSQSLLTSHVEIEGRTVAARGDVAGAVWQFSLGIVAWFDLGAPPKNDANF